MSAEDRAFLRAIVSVWLALHRSVDGGNDPRVLVEDHDWMSAVQTTESLVESGHLIWVDAGVREASITDAGANDVVPTPLGVFEALS